MTPAQNTAIAARSGRAFRFLKNGSQEFFPGAGTRLRFASKAADELELVDIPAGLLSSTDSVTVVYGIATVFVGTVEKIADNLSRGDDRAQTVTCLGPWARLARLVFQQQWGVADAESSVLFSSPRVVLNQSPLGAAVDMADALREICQFAAQKCGFSYSSANVAAEPLCLPFDETRDITCADAIRRELRFFPRKIVRFDYSSGTPAIHIDEPDTASDASYVASVPKSSRRYDYNAHPVTCVDIYTSDVDITFDDETGEATNALQHRQFYPEDSSLLSGLDCLHFYIPLAHGTSSTSFEKLEVETEQIGVVNGVANEKEWWRTKHPRLHDVANSQLTISDFGYSPPDFTPRRITNCTVGALRKFGLKAELVRFHCKAKIETADDVEDEIYLTMDFVVTNASTKTYTQQTGSSSTASESLPEGLAQALYEQRAGSLVNEWMDIRLGDELPALGDACDGLVLQEIDVDCADVTARLHFGQPEHVSPEDMRSLLNGFRQRGFASNAPQRTGEPDEDDAAPDNGIQPVSSTEFCPGVKSKTTIKGSAGKPIELDSAKVTDDTMQVRTLTIRDESGGTSTVQYLATSDATVDGADNDDDEPDPESYCNSISEEHGGTSAGDPGNDISGEAAEGTAEGGGPGAGGGNAISLWPCKKEQT